ncbi:transcriptional regulator domain-containing protein [Mesorhizobium xinjiangense]|uniref:transcriptional regulator domain-containing protein n=1 Tax=Mesorhizobium xinjiangense TaxID=2678685 RepID=UPI001F348570|nr:DUF6499 domain-containing protein [Mesorhizobium xinjiangense]
MPEGGDWRSAAAYKYISDLDPAAVAWEFLRRNPDYRQDYLQLTKNGQLSRSGAAALSDKWGLRFRYGPEPERIGSTHLLDPFREPRHDLSRRCTRPARQRSP